MTKNIVTVSIIICIVVLVGVIFGAFVLPAMQKKEATLIKNTQEKVAQTGTRIATFSLAEVSAHNKERDCWLVVSQGVYDVTKFIASHPGGKEAVIKNCGKDATSVFESKHPDSAKNTLEDYFIGALQ